ncbi:MAG: hypothetical protein OEY97_10945 [Nitrospirota bacterium]|nr:hypothetical protein [Nitrospirota bacterium]
MNTKITLATLLTLALTAPLSAHAAEWEASAGLGYDSNAFRTPGQNYDDYSDLTACPPTGIPGCNPITPNVQSGMFIPVELKVGNGAKDGFALSYNLDADLYLGGLSNANNFTHEFAADRKRVERNGDTRITRELQYSLVRRSKIYYDRDTGERKQTAAGNDVADRFSYLGLGVEGNRENRTGDHRAGFNWGLQYRDYDSVTGAPDYDHVIAKAGVLYGIPLGAATSMLLEGDADIESYFNRHARNADATFSGTLRQYLDLGLKASLRQEMPGNFVAKLTYELTSRTDNHVGYHDFTGNDVSLRLYHHGDVLKVSAFAGYEVRSYDTALAFDAAGQPVLDYSVTRAGIKAEVPMGETSSLWADLDTRNVDTNDTRYAYERTQLTAGMAWQF